MKFALLIGSHARGDNDASSDCDVLLINIEESKFDISVLPVKDKSLINIIFYDEATFLRLIEIGSLFVFHVFQEGVLLEGDLKGWERLKSEFQVQSNFREELLEISETTKLLSKTKIFGGKYLTPLVNAFTELKNACIFSLAHHSVYEFNKKKCLEKALRRINKKLEYGELKYFYDYSVRGLDIPLPFDPNDKVMATTLLKGTNKVVREMCHACK